MDGLFPGLFAIATAIYVGLCTIADAIRNRSVDVRFRDPLKIESEKKANGTSS